MTALALVLVAASANGWPTLERSLDAKPIALLEIPDASKSLQHVERSSFRKWVPLLMGQDAKVVRGAGVRVVSAWYGSSKPGHPDVVLSTDVQRESDSVRDMVERWWTANGFTPSEPRTVKDWRLRTFEGPRGEVTVAANASHGRVGWSMGGARAEQLGKTQSPSLADDEAFRTMVSYAPRADMRGLIHVPRAFGWLLKQPGGNEAARLISRLGLAGVQMAPFAVDLSSRREAKINGTSTLKGEITGAMASLGPALNASWPKSVPDDARGFMTFSVVPAKVLRAVFFWMAADNPLQLTLVQAQLSALERQAGKGLDRDVLGDTPRAWTVYEDRRGALVAELPVNDPAAARALAEAFFASYPTLSPQPVQFGSVSGFALRGARAGAVAFTDRTVLLSTEEPALKRHFRQEPKETLPSLLVGGKGVVFGQGRDLLRTLADALRLPAQGDRLDDTTGFRIEREGSTYSFHARMRR